MGRITKTGELVVFFALAFVIGWAAFVPVQLYHAFPLGAFIYLYAPALAAVITAGIFEGRAGVRSVLERYLIWRNSIGWYALAVLLLPAIFVLAALASVPRASLWLGSPWYFVVASFAFLMVITSGEEIGWRGFALSRLRVVVRSPLLAAIVLGLLWGAWHVPLYLGPQPSSFPFPLFLLFTVSISVVYSVLFDNTRGSLLTAVLLHVSTDIAPRILRLAAFTSLSYSIVTALVLASAIVLYVAKGRTSSVADGAR